MKKIVEIISIILLICFSFFVTDKTAKVASSMDEIMVKIKENYKDYKVDSIDATINKDTIIPGIYGREVNINKSYKNMKQSGYYSSNLFVYDYIKPKVSLEDNLDKYIISGNKEKRMVSLIFLLNGNYDINNILKIVDENDIKVNFFIDEEFLFNNNKLVMNLINNNHTVGNLSKNMDYTDSSFGWIDTVIKKVGNQKNGYCYSIIDKDKNLEQCTLLDNYTIRPNIITGTNPLINIKDKLTSGSLIAISPNKQLEEELSSIIKFIKSKGYTIVNLEEHLSEK